MKLIAETAWHHDGDFVFLLDLVQKICKKSSPDIIKLHITLNWDEYMHTDHDFYHQFKGKLFSKKQWDEVLKYILGQESGLMLLLNDTESIDFGLKFEPEIVEIHSVCLNDIKLLNHLKNSIDHKTKIAIGIGGSTLYEIENAVNTLQTSNIILMHGFQNYPTKYEDINLRKIFKIKNLFPEYEHGYADHTAWNEANNILISLLGIASGLNYLEKHVTTNFGEERADWEAAISIEMFNELRSKTEIYKSCLGSGALELNDGEKKYSIYGPNKKAALLSRNIKKGEVFSLNDFNFKRTRQITDLSQIDIINSIGWKFTDNLNRNHCLKKGDLIP